MFSAVLSGLPPATAVTYRPHGADAHGEMVDFGDHSFETPPALVTPTKIALLADQGTFMGFGSNVTSQMVRDFGHYPGPGWPSLIHHGGDISYAGIDTNIPELNGNAFTQMHCSSNAFSRSNGEGFERLPVITVTSADEWCDLRPTFDQLTD